MTTNRRPGILTALPSGWRHRSLRQTAVPIYDAARTPRLSGNEPVRPGAPGFLRSLSADLHAEALAGCLCPVLLSNDSVAIFALETHVAGDHADELARRIVRHGWIPAVPFRYIVEPAMLLAIERLRVGAQPAAMGSTVPAGRSALAGAFLELVAWGVRQGASDLHINPAGGEARQGEVRYTVAGRYVAPGCFRHLSAQMLLEMLAVAWMDVKGGNGAVFDPHREQQGSLLCQVDGLPVALRWASLPAEAGPSVCLRVLGRPPLPGSPDLAGLGYAPSQVVSIQEALLTEGGAVVFAGSVGSGKSTTLAALMACLPAHRKLVSLEDPVEYPIPRAIQVSVARSLEDEGHQAFAAKLRALKRSGMHDVLLGEVRDRATGRAFMDLASAGVNVYTTLHAGSVEAIPRRLASDFIGVPADFLAQPGLFRLLVHQVLLPCLCPHCALPVDSLREGMPHLDGRPRSDAYWRQWRVQLLRVYRDQPRSVRIRNPEGCTDCRRGQPDALYGLTGLTVAADVRRPDVPAPRLLLSEPGHSWQDGGTALSSTALRQALDKAWQGQIDPRDIEVRFPAFAGLMSAAVGGVSAGVA